MRNCAVCGKPVKGGIVMGGVLLCRSCEPDVKAEIDRLHSEGKTVSVSRIAREMFRENYSVGSYTLRDIPEALWTAAKHVAVDEGLNLRELILKSLQEYVSKA